MHCTWSSIVPWKLHHSSRSVGWSSMHDCRQCQIRYVWLQFQLHTQAVTQYYSKFYLSLLVYVKVSSHFAESQLSRSRKRTNAAFWAGKKSRPPISSYICTPPELSAIEILTLPVGLEPRLTSNCNGLRACHGAARKEAIRKRMRPQEKYCEWNTEWQNHTRKLFWANVTFITGCRPNMVRDGRVLLCWTCDRGVRIPPVAAVYQRLTQHVIPLGSVNEYLRKLGSKRAYHAMY